MHHQPLALWATARWVEHGWDDGAPCTIQCTTHPSLMSHCSWGGSWVEWWCTQPLALYNAPPVPASWATAHGVDHGWNNGTHSPPPCTMYHLPQPHEPLLVGWITGRTTMHHPPPASRATALGWNVGEMMMHAANAPPTPSLMSHCLWDGVWVRRLEATTVHYYSINNHCHKLLLVGGKGCYVRGGVWQGGLSTGVQ